MTLHRAFVVGGVGLLVIGIVALVVPGFLALNIGRAVVVLLGTVALLQAFGAVQKRRNTEPQQAATPTPEFRIPVQTPGQSMNEAFGQFIGKPHPNYRYSTAEGLKAAVVAVLTRYRDITESEARKRIERGSWTDDPVAAAFFTEESDQDQSVSRRVRGFWGSNGQQGQELPRTVDAIAEIAGADDLNSPEKNGTESSRDRWSSAGRGESHSNSRDFEGVVRRETQYWVGIGAITMFSVGVGVLTEQSGILLVGVVGLFYLAYASSSAVTGEGLTLERSVSETAPSPSDEVEVTVTVTNDGSETLPDVRLVDRVPGALSVVAGSPRHGTVLRPGEQTEFSYTVTARRGRHEFGPLQAIVRNITGSVEYERPVRTASTTAFTCVPSPESIPVSIPLRNESTRLVGRKETASAGDGTEFYATRLYQAGDPLNRIDWGRKAKTGEFATLLFREERTASVVLVFDTSSYLAPSPRGDHSLDRSVAAGRKLFTTLQEEGHLTGIGALYRTDCWLAPGSGKAHRMEANQMLATHPGLDPEPRESPEQSQRAREILLRRLPSDSQVIVFTPLCRPQTVDEIRRLEASGHPVTVVSPDPTRGRTPAQRLAQVGRKTHISGLRADGIPVLDWGWNESLLIALSRFAKRSQVAR